MKKKIAILSVALMVAAAGVASAGAAWGKYKGYDIIRLTVNGKTIKATDAPAISFNDRTMVPIYMLKEAGINYSWDGETNTVNVSKSSSTNNDSIKAMFMVAEHFDSLHALGVQLGDFYWSLSNSYNAILSSYNTKQQLDAAYDDFNNIVDQYNDYNKATQDLLAKAKSNGIDLSIANTILNNYYQSIEIGRSVLDSLDGYYNYGDKSYVDSYFTNIQKFINNNKSSNGASLALKQKYVYYNKAMNS